MRRYTGLIIATGLAGCSFLSNSQNIPGPSAASRALPLTDCSKMACIYIANGGTSSIAPTVTVYAASATGNAAPIRTIAGSKTKLSAPEGIAVDASRKIYVTNDTPSVTVYAAGASGNAAPAQDITGSKTLLDNPHGIALDSADNVYVDNIADPVSVPASISVYAAGASGNVAPIQDISGSNTQLNGVTGVATNSGGTIFAGNSDPGKITIYAAGATGNVKPVRSISGSKTQLNGLAGVALDATGKVYVVQTEASVSSVLVFGSKASGNVKPLTAISGSKTGLTFPSGIAVDSAGKIYVSNAFVSCECPNNGSVVVFATGSSGNVAPSQVIKGSSTQLDGSFGIAVR